VMLCGVLVAPTSTVPKSRFAGVSVMAAGRTAVPVTVAEPCCPASVPFTTMTPLRVPEALGAKVTCRLQLTRPVTVRFKQLSVSVKSPEIEMDPTVRFPAPAFMTNTCCEVDFPPTVVRGKVSMFGVNVTVGIATAVPVKAIVCEPYWSVTTKDPDKVPTAVGANATSILQAAWPLSVAPQLFTSIKSPDPMATEMEPSAVSPEFVRKAVW
jgi:hypothetical protein